MKTNSIIRLLLMAVILVMCENHVKATVFYNNNEGTNHIEFPFGSFDNEATGSVLRVTYVIQPQNGWTPNYKIKFYNRVSQSTIFEQSVTADGTIDIPLRGYNSTDKYNICAELTGEWVMFKNVESVSAGTASEKTDVTLTFSSSSVTVGMRQSFTPPTLRARANGKNISGLSYTFTSSNTDVATVDNNGSVTLNAVGTTTITVNFAGNEIYNRATASYTLTVVATYKLTFILDNEEFDVKYLQANEVITTPTPPYKSGYTYEWLNVPWRMPANDLVIYGFYVKLDQSVTVSVGSTGYSTYCSTQPLRLVGTEDIKAYIAKAKSDSEVKLSQVVGTVAAGTGLVLKGWSSNVTAQFEIAESGETYEGNLLVGVMSDVEINSSNLYVLVNKDGIAKFADTGYNAAVVPAGKAYLQAPGSGSRILNITFEDDETTGISVLQSMGEVQSSSYYNLSGQRVETPTKGIYIIDGKKVIIK